MRNEPLCNLPLTQLLARFSDNNPTPGGGSAAAMTVALAASLATMVASISREKLLRGGTAEGSPDEAARFWKMVETGCELHGRSRGMMDWDAEAFDAVRAAYALPKGNDAEKAARKSEIQMALKHAVSVPWDVATNAVRCAELAHELMEIGVPSAVTDVGVGALLALTAAESAILNVAINLDSIKDEEYVSEYRDRIRDIRSRVDALRTSTWAILQGRIRSLAD